ncbi:MAG: PAS domain-containing sensor histidine kinase, partial [Rhodocyclaceae bacterium]
YRNVAGGEFVCFVRNITERKKAEAALRDEKERIETILDTVADPIFVKDDDHRIVLANPAFYEMFASDKSAVIGKTLAEAVPADERQHFLEVDRQVLDTGLPDLREETLTVGGFTRTIVTRKTRLALNGGGKYLVGSIHDITEPKRLELALQQSNQEMQGLARSVLETREEDRRKIARELHDDLGHRVTSISMDLGKLESKLLASESEAKALMPAILDQVYQFADATRRICEDLRPGMLDALGLPAAIESHVDSFAARTGIPCELVMSHDDFAVDAKVGINLFRILQEALNNATKYSKATKILVTLQFAEHEISLVVEDNGIGLVEAGNDGRIGFGLLGMRERVNTLNGQLSISSEPGRGVRIEVVIPT